MTTAGENAIAVRSGTDILVDVDVEYTSHLDDCDSPLLGLVSEPQKVGVGIHGQNA